MTFARIQEIQKELDRKKKLGFPLTLADAHVEELLEVKMRELDKIEKAVDEAWERNNK